MTGFSDSAQAMSLVAFSAVATVTLLLCVMTGPDRDDLDEFYTGYGSLSPMRNGLAIAGDYISAATVLGTGGVIALCGYDGIVLALSTALSLLLMMFLLAEPLRNTGRFTMGDVFARRMPGRCVRDARARGLHRPSSSRASRTGSRRRDHPQPVGSPARGALTWHAARSGLGNGASSSQRREVPDRTAPLPPEPSVHRRARRTGDRRDAPAPRDDPRNEPS